MRKRRAKRTQKWHKELKAKQMNSRMFVESLFNTPEWSMWKTWCDVTDNGFRPDFVEMYCDFSEGVQLTNWKLHWREMLNFMFRGPYMEDEMIKFRRSEEDSLKKALAEEREKVRKCQEILSKYGIQI